jgi:hypothetical protein
MNGERRTLLRAIAGLGAGAIAAPRVAGTGAPADRPAAGAGPREARLLWARLVGDLTGKPVFFFTQGSVWGFKPQADDLTTAEFAKRLYGYSGVAARRIVPAGDGWTLHAAYWAFYRDPVTDAITDRIPNPYTGRIDTAKPLSGAPAPRPLDLTPAPGTATRVRRLGASAIVETSTISRFRSPDISWHKLEANLEDYVCRAAALDAGAPHLPSHYSQSLVAEWQTWTGMHGTPGHILFKGNGEPLSRLDAVPQDQIAAIERFFPGTLARVQAWR